MKRKERTWEKVPHERGGEDVPKEAETREARPAFAVVVLGVQCVEQRAVNKVLRC